MTAPSSKFFQRLKTRSFFGFTWSGVQSIFRKEMIQLIRDPYLVMFIITLPIIQLMVTGLAVKRDLNHIPTIIMNYDRQNASQELIKDFENSRLFSPRQVSSEKALMTLIRKHNERVGIVIPPDYSETVLRGDEPAQVNIIVDGTDANIAKTIVNGIQVILARHSEKVIRENGLAATAGFAGNPAGQALPALSGGVQGVIKILYNPDLSASYFLVPAILAIVMHMLTILFTSFAIVRERESGTLELLMVTPIRAPDLMLGKMLPYAFIGLIDMMLTLAVMVHFFHIPVSGSFGFLVLSSIVFILASLGMGLLISILSITQVQAIQLTVAIFLPSLLLTGFVFPLEPMPWFIKLISYSLPLTYYLQIIRGVVIKGIGPEALWGQLSVLLAMALAMLGASILRFKKQTG